MKPRLTINVADNRLDIEIQVRQWGAFAFLSIVLLFLTAALVIALLSLTTGRPQATGGSPVLAVVLLLICDMLFLAQALYLVVGKEKILLTPETLTVKSDFLGYGLTRIFETTQISGLRVTAGFQAWARWGFRRSLVLTYKGRKHRFGIELPKGEAEHALKQIQMYLRKPSTAS